jgi:hypothetical protein
MTMRFDLIDKADVGIQTMGLYLEVVESRLRSQALAGIRKQERAIGHATVVAHFAVRELRQDIELLQDDSA